jgi:hypothetical protein
MSENEHGKMFFISEYFNQEEKNLSFLPILFQDGHPDEAMTLCLVYIDRYAQKLLWPGDKSSKNFVDALVTLGGDPILALVHPLQAIRRFKKMKSPWWQQIAAGLETVFPGPNYELQAQPDFLANLAPHFSRNELHKVKGELWRTTIAAVAYYWLRNPSVHGLGPGQNTSFSGSTYEGKPVPNLDLKRLHDAAAKLLAELRRRSEKTGQFFGDNRILGDD